MRISQAEISHGDLKVSITTDYLVSQPYAPFWGTTGPGARTVVVPQTQIDVNEEESQSVSLPGNNTVADLAKALARIKTSPRDMISILQGLRTCWCTARRADHSITMESACCSYRKAIA